VRTQSGLLSRAWVYGNACYVAGPPALLMKPVVVEGGPVTSRAARCWSDTRHLGSALMGLSSARGVLAGVQRRTRRFQPWGTDPTLVALQARQADPAALRGVPRVPGAHRLRQPPRGALRAAPGPGPLRRLPGPGAHASSGPPHPTPNELNDPPAHVHEAGSAAEPNAADSGGV